RRRRQGQARGDGRGPRRRVPSRLSARRKDRAMTQVLQTLPLTDRQSWKALRDHHAKTGTAHLRALFADDKTRGERLTAEGVGLYLDYSKNRVTDETLTLLVKLADEAGLRDPIDAMFRA